VRLGVGFLVMLAAACGGTDPEPGTGPGIPAGGALAIVPVTANIPPGSAEEVLAAFRATYDAGARGYFVSYRWSELEPQAGQYHLADLQTTLQTITGLGFNRVLVGIQVINTTRKETPPDLLAVGWDAPVMRARFNQLLDRVVPLFGGNVAWLAIGNEVDAYLGPAAQWGPYATFFAAARQHARGLRPGLPVGVTTIFDGARGPWRSQVQALNALADVAIWTYYGNDGAFRALGPEAGPQALREMVSLAAGKPVVVQELGQASSAINGGSDDLQARFFAATLAEWSAIGATAMPFVSQFALHDFPGWLCDELLQYYGIGSSTAFREFLCTLGLRRQDESAKPAWDSVRAFGRRAGS
jgi:hypothetical protein